MLLGKNPIEAAGQASKMTCVPRGSHTSIGYINTQHTHMAAVDTICAHGTRAWPQMDELFQSIRVDELP